MASVALLAYAYPPENEIGAARAHRFARYLPDYGYSVSVFSSGEFPGPPAVPPAHRIPRHPQLWEHALRKFLMPAEEGFSWIAPVQQAVAGAAAREKFCAILSTSPPATAHLAAGRLARRLRLPWIADFRDPIAASPVRKAAMMPVIDPWLEKWIVRRANAVTVCTNVMHRDICLRHPGREEQFHLIWNGFDPQRLYQPPVANGSGRRRLVHLGSLYEARDPNPLLAGIARTIRKGRISGDALEVRLIGTLEPVFEQRQPDVWRFLREQGALTVISEQQPPQVVREEIAAADSLLLVDMNPGGVGYALPGKVFEYIPAGRPVVAMTSPGAPVVWVMENSGIPTQFLYAGDSDERIEQVIEDWMAIPRRQYEPSPWFWEEFNGQRQVGQLAALLDRLTGRAA